MGFVARDNTEGKQSKKKDSQGFPKVPDDQKDKDDLGYWTKAKKNAGK